MVAGRLGKVPDWETSNYKNQTSEKPQISRFNRMGISVVAGELCSPDVKQFQHKGTKNGGFFTEGNEGNKEGCCGAGEFRGGKMKVAGLRGWAR